MTNADRLRNEIIAETNCYEYIMLYKDTAQLDGWFSPQELRIIADKIEELAKLEEKK